MIKVASRAPAWFWLTAAILLVWNLFGVMAFYMDITVGPEERAAMPDYDRMLMDARPAWQLWAYGTAVWGGSFGAVALLLGRRIALGLFIISAIGVVFSMGWALVATDLIAVKGVVTAAAFPAFILAVALASIWLARSAARRGFLK
ncbi:sugar transporter [Sphingomonas sp. BGYR3]|uniref:sugar transporter n=1 Tax=Sphingomonas sp. BGYR3 TaxID=2975483 RepID=UPI0021A91317|nr:sugar transporter [Sphingomonas sp. BGYR3]MDG5487618.1 sugar transporter [Sphingomonas sp. BGYR3]